MTSTFDLFRRLTRKPAGHRAFSMLFGLKAPYFRSIGMRVREMRPHHAEVVVPLRWRVTNHIGTLHAIAACNGLEAAMGLLAEATVPDGHRWIPKGMRVDYLAKSTTDLLCTADTDPSDWAAPGEVAVRVQAVRTDGVVAIEGVITIWVTEAKAR